MADKKWIGAADAIAQVDTALISGMSGTPSDTSYRIIINSDEVAVDGDTDVNTTAAALQVALAASTNPYFSSITWTVNAATITATASSAGNPHTFTTGVTGGTGTIGSTTNVTASSGPNDYNVARNWDSGSVPVSTDSVIIEDSAISITHGLDQSAVTLASLTISKSFTGRIGLKEKAFATTSSGNTTNAAKDEYKEQYLQIGATILNIGENNTNRPQNGSALIKINIGTVASTITVFETGSTAFEESKPAIQLLGVNVGNNLFVQAAKASVGIAVHGFEVSTFNDINIGDGLDAGGVVLGDGVTFLNWAQKSGDNFLNGAATITKVDCLGGTLQTNGDYTITTVNLGEGSVFIPNHEKTAGVEITTLNFLSAATIDASRSSAARTITTLNLAPGAEITADSTILTITNLELPSGDYNLSLAE